MKKAAAIMAVFLCFTMTISNIAFAEEGQETDVFLHQGESEGAKDNSVEEDGVKSDKDVENVQENGTVTEATNEEKQTEPGDERTEETAEAESKTQSVRTTKSVRSSQGREVKDYAEFKEALKEAQEIADSLPEEEEMEEYTITLTGNIYAEEFYNSTSSSLFELDNGVDVKILSKAESKYTIGVNKNFSGSKKNACIFRLNNSSKLTMENVILDCDGKGHFGGFAVNALGSSNVVMNNGTFITGAQGGINAPVVIKTRSTFVMNGGEISSNYTEGHPIVSGGGAVYVSNSKFEMNGGVIKNNRSDTWGGGIMINNAEFVMNDGIVTDNTCGTWGGGIYAGNAVVTINDGEVSDNTAVYGGGGLAAVETDNIEIHGGIIDNNKANGGAGIYTHSCENFMIENIDITNNQAVIQNPTESVKQGEGGAGMELIMSSGTIKNSTIKDNYTDLSAGAIQLLANTHVSLCDVEITGNVAETHAGAICVTDAYTASSDTKSTLMISDSLISGNIAKSTFSEDGESSSPHAPGGGAVYAHENCEVYLNEGTCIESNKTLNYGNGGAVYICFGGLLEINGAVIENNQSENHGGGIYLDGTGSYEGVDHAASPDDGYGTGSLMRFYSGRISGNTAAQDGGGIYIDGSNMIEKTEYRGGSCLMEDGVITDNHADNRGGGVFLEAAESGEHAGAFRMTGGALYFNVAGEDGNTSSGAEDAGAELFAQGGNTAFTVPTAEKITAYIQDRDNIYVPDEDRTVWFTAWYDDYSDQDAQYGKAEDKYETGQNTGRYMSSKVIDRMEFLPLENVSGYEALILDRETELKLTKNVSGEGIKENESYIFQISVNNLPDIQKAGSRYPADIQTGVSGDSLGTPENGISYITFNADGKALVTLKAGASLTVDGLPAGTEFTVTETDAGTADHAEITAQNCTDGRISDSARMIEGKKNTQWKADAEYITTSVVYDNIYAKQEMDGTEPDNIKSPDKTDSGKPDGSPSTGDTSVPAVWMLLMTAAGVTAVIMMKRYKR